jgi:hypothetical protein
MKNLRFYIFKKYYIGFTLLYYITPFVLLTIFLILINLIEKGFVNWNEVFDFGEMDNLYIIVYLGGIPLIIIINAILRAYANFHPTVKDISIEKFNYCQFFSLVQVLSFILVLLFFLMRSYFLYNHRNFIDFSGLLYLSMVSVAYWIFTSTLAYFTLLIYILIRKLKILFLSKL